MKSTEDRIKLILAKLSIIGQLVGVYNDNPFRSGQSLPDKKQQKFFKSRGITLAKPIQFRKIRNPITKELTDCHSGDRIMYANPFNQDIPCVVYIGSSRARLFYEKQPVPQRDILCTNCFETSLSL